MSEDRVWKPTGRVSDAYGAWQAILAVGGTAWAVLVAVSGAAFTTIQGVMDQGWGAVFLAALGAASAAALALAALFFGLAALAGGFRRVWPPPAPPRQEAAPADGDARQTAPQAPPSVRELAEAVRDDFSALEKRVSEIGAKADRLEALCENLRNAIHANAATAREEGEALREAIRKSVASALEQVRKEQEASAARLKAVEEAAERRTKAVFDVLSDEFGPKIGGLDAKIDEYAECLGERLRGLETALRDSRRQVFDILRACDDAERLRSLDTKATGLFDKLFFAKERDYPDEDAWRTEYLSWKGCIENYWAILRSHSGSVGEPFALTEGDFDGKNGIPGNALFARDAMRVLYQIMLVVNERHARLRDNASVFMAEKCRPPANPA